jgi:aspartate aminotransferase-like enzyme
LPPEVVAAMQRPMIPHRGKEFRAFHLELLERLRRIHRTDGDVLIWPGSGSAGWEIAVVNLLSPGTPVLVAVTGDFGERFAWAAGSLGAEVRRLDVPWGEAVTPDALRAALEANSDVAAVLLTHNETSTGVTNPLRDLAAVARDHGALVLVDAVSSAAGLPLEVDGWGLDFVLSGSQKAWMCPPGVVIVAVSERAWEANARAGYDTYFWNMRKAREAARDGSTPTTPPLTLLYALDAATRMIEREGIEAVWERHRRVGEATRSGVERLGLRLLPEASVASNTVTALEPPEGVSAKAIVDRMREDHGVTVAGGQGHMADSVVRIGHMGWVDESDIEACLDALESTLGSL